MSISTIKKILIVSSVTVCMTAIAMPANLSCGCSHAKAISVNCTSATVNKPSWWSWLTKNESSQFHFFDLVELLHVNSDVDTSNKQQLDKAES